MYCVELHHMKKASPVFFSPVTSTGTHETKRHTSDVLQVRAVLQAPAVLQVPL